LEREREKKFKVVSRIFLKTTPQFWRFLKSNDPTNFSDGIFENLTSNDSYLAQSSSGLKDKEEDKDKEEEYKTHRNASLEPSKSRTWINEEKKNVVVSFLNET